MAFNLLKIWITHWLLPLQILRIISGCLVSVMLKRAQKVWMGFSLVERLGLLITIFAFSATLWICSINLQELIYSELLLTSSNKRLCSILVDIPRSIQQLSLTKLCLLNCLRLLVFIDRTHYVINNILDSLFFNYLSRKTH